MAKGDKGTAVAEPPASKLDARSISIDLLRESPLNTRKTFDKGDMADLTTSIREHGILTPLIVRSDGKFFEILAGARRFRAAQECGLKELPCSVVKVTSDENALEVVIVENLQRANIHPLEEAEGFNNLLERSTGDVEGVAAKTGKTRAYIYQSLALLNLIEPFVKIFKERRFPKETATMLARLSKDDQKSALDLWRHQDPSVSNVRDWIERSVMLEVKNFPWKLDDAELLKKAGPCSTCPKRSGVEKELFKDMTTGDRCIDPGCYQTKLANFIDRTVTQFKKDGKPFVGVWTSWHNEKPKEGILPQGHWREINGKKCEDQKNGIVLDGATAGRVLQVCANPSCKVHGNGIVPDGDDTMQATRAKQNAEVKKQKNERVVRIAILTAAKDKLKDPPSVDTMRHVCGALWTRLWHEHKKSFVKVFGIKGEEIKGSKSVDFDGPIHKMIDGMKEQEEFDRFIVSIGLMEELDPRYSKATALKSFAKELKVDIADIEKQIEAQVLAKKKDKKPKSEKKAPASKSEEKPAAKKSEAKKPKAEKKSAKK